MRNLTLLTDLYQLTMMQGYFFEGKHKTRAVFDLFFRQRENLNYAKEIMESRGLSQALIVTSDYHVPRALALSRQVGIEATGKGSPSKPEYFIKNHIREGLSWIKFTLESIL